MEGTGDRRKRVQRLKKIILAVNAAFIVIPVIVSVVLGIRVIQLNQKIQKLENLLAAKENEADEVAGIYVTTPVEQSLRDTVSMQQTVEAEEEKVYQKEIYLTFDDGPSSNTDKILDVLKEYDVKATFFVVGKTDEQSIRAYQRIVEEGHTLAMHSYSHIYNEIYESKDNFMASLSDYRHLAKVLPVSGRKL